MNTQAGGYTRKEAAARLNCSIPTIDRMLRLRRLGFAKLGSKTLINVADIEALLPRPAARPEQSDARRTDR